MHQESWRASPHREAGQDEAHFYFGANHRNLAGEEYDNGYLSRIRVSRKRMPR
jgi:hypothetical protein